METGNEVVQTAFRLPRRIIDKLDALARDDYRNRTKMVVALIERAYRETEEKKRKEKEE